MKKILAGCCLFLSLQLMAQEHLPNDLAAICYTWGISFPEHQQKNCDITTGPKRFDQQFEILVTDKKDDYQVMAFFVPDSLYDGMENAAVRSMVKATHFASNLEDSNIAMHSLEPTYMQATYAADWGAVYYFQPKPVLSHYEQCQMVVLEKAGRGIFYTLYFFNDFSEEVEEMIWNPKFLREVKVKSRVD